MEEVLREKLTGATYHPDNTSQWTREIADEIKQSLKMQDMDRYKYVVQVMIGEQRGEGVSMSARCFWDHKRDHYVQKTFQNVRACSKDYLTRVYEKSASNPSLGTDTLSICLSIYLLVSVCSLPSLVRRKPSSVWPSPLLPIITKTDLHAGKAVTMYTSSTKDGSKWVRKSHFHTPHFVIPNTFSSRLHALLFLPPLHKLIYQVGPRSVLVVVGQVVPELLGELEELEPRVLGDSLVGGGGDGESRASARGQFWRLCGTRYSLTFLWLVSMKSHHESHRVHS